MNRGILFEMYYDVLKRVITVNLHLIRYIVFSFVGIIYINYMIMYIKFYYLIYRMKDYE